MIAVGRQVAAQAVTMCVIHGEVNVVQIKSILIRTEHIYSLRNIWHTYFSLIKCLFAVKNLFNKGLWEGSHKDACDKI